MTQGEFIKKLEKLTLTILDTVYKKNSDYSGTDALANFYLIENLTQGEVTALDGLYTRLVDKVARTGNLLTGDPNVSSEPLSDTLLDLASYALIMHIVYENDNRGTDTPVV